jgi:hypothetical protein
MNIVRNFATHALESLQETFDAQGRRMAALKRTDPLFSDLDQTRNTIVEFASRASKAIKFIGPTNGVFLNRLDQDDDGVDLPRLPFECICLEVALDLEERSVAGTAAVRQPDRAVILAYYPDRNLGYSQAARDLHGELHPDEFLVTAAFGFKDEPWRMYPGAVLVTSRAEQPGICRLQVDNAPRSILLLPIGVKFDSVENQYGAAVSDLGREAIAICEMCNVLQCTNIVTETLSPPTALSSKRASKGRVPFFEYRILKIEERTTGNAELGGSHASPRLHYRRGHIRRLPDSRKTWVRPAMVGDKSRGLIMKDYDVTAAGAKP